ncbi:archease [Pyxidicoccus xibeiensis]|uniref:archease n=1 Tax=Pyxidicoccus xibeiensis TaxID=2906759 RepID=UPI0020A7AE30|nr:archease [Pyxidicoccus xibeiensis]MCP3143914.1 archease [Pyxidicoccus xibeiensis]
MDVGLAPGAAAPRWEHLTRGTERVVRGNGRSPEEAFEQAAVALCALVADPAAVEVREEIPVECDAPDRERLLADWLRAVIQLMAARDLRFRCFAVRLDGRHLFGLAFGEHVDRARHPDAVDVRGVTLVGPSVRRTADGRWTAECEVEV